MARHATLVPLALTIAGALAAADPPGSATAATVAAPTAPATGAASATAAAAGAPAAQPDPTAAVVAQGHEIYRQRDLDALVAVAQRYAKGKLDPAACDAVRQALVRLLVARERFNEGVGDLPPALTGKARDAFVLDVLDYQADVAPPAAPVAATAAVPAPAEAPAAPGPVIVSLPALTQARTIDKIGRRQLVIGIALLFPDAAAAKACEARAPLIRDALLGCVQQLAPAQFVEPDQAMLKSAFGAAVHAKVPEFPADGVLIPQLDAGPAEAAPAGP
jgi:flagellar basal body-associated protein FliL